MQMHAMNNYNRGFGGQPQPQRQGPRRGNRGGGGFRQTRFDNNQQRNQNQNQGQRPIENKPAEKPAQAAQNQTPNQNQQPRPNQQPAQNQQARPNQPAANQNQAQRPNQTPAQGQKTTPPAQNQQPQPNNQVAQQGKPAQQTPPKPVADKVDSVAAPTEAPKPLMQQNTGFNQQAKKDDNNQPQKNMNGGFGGPNKQGGTWAQGNRPAGNRQFGGPRQGGPGQGQQGGPRQGGPGQQGGPPRNQQRGNQGGRPPRDDMSGKPPAQREEHMLMNKLKDLMGPILDLPPLEQTESKFSGRSRLYIGNLTNDVSEEEITQLFSAYGETAELFVNKEKNFGFIKMDYRVNAEKAKRELDGKMRNGRALRVRFAPHNSAVRVKNLPPFVSNELLYRAFEIFGKIERAYVRVDDRGKTLGEGVVEYARKPSALAAIRNCTEKCFFLTSSLRPVIVESYEEPDEFDGYPEKNLPKKHPEFMRAREVGPRFSEPNSFEHEYGTRWKQLHELHKQKEDALKKELAAEEEKLEAQMEYAKYEHETELLREQLRQREQDRERQKRSWELAELAAEQRRGAERHELQQREDELALRMRKQDDELRRRQQENTLFVQAQRLNSLLDRQDGMFDSNQSPMDGGFREQFDMGRGYDDGPASRWEGPRQIEDFPNKRRRF
ncbi:hypothetical protein JYU34_009052 [Plutella xylostella]|uniref:RRM domain-containing protein n=1 Tax=Plutella xylostella TaxID=51655 RepID=A0ABQ7QMX4_PLUXY|nr:hypothetical protein JYU34_009052 [Plutella xylostella]